MIWDESTYSMKTTIQVYKRKYLFYLLKTVELKYSHSLAELFIFRGGRLREVMRWNEDLSLHYTTIRTTQSFHCRLYSFCKCNTIISNKIWQHKCKPLIKRTRHSYFCHQYGSFCNLNNDEFCHFPMARGFSRGVFVIAQLLGMR